MPGILVSVPGRGRLVSMYSVDIILCSISGYARDAGSFLGGASATILSMVLFAPNSTTGKAHNALLTFFYK
ncbi:MAG: hypothetical protein O2779_03810 [Nanoarchaeota archaeon]|nr:hypothetical protein [Nanoarchaeota archaeon]